MTDAYDRFCAWDAHHDDGDLYPPRPAAPVLSPPLPPINAEPDTHAPATSRFRRRPVEQMQPGDYLMLEGRMYRLAAKRSLRASIRLALTLYPVAGGRIITETLYPRNWLLTCSTVAQGESHE